MAIVQISYNETVRGKDGKSLTATAEVKENENPETVLAGIKDFVRKNLRN